MADEWTPNLDMWEGCATAELEDDPTKGSNMCACIYWGRVREMMERDPPVSYADAHAATVEFIHAECCKDHGGPKCNFTFVSPKMEVMLHNMFPTNPTYDLTPGTAEAAAAMGEDED